MALTHCPDCGVEYRFVGEYWLHSVGDCFSNLKQQLTQARERAEKAEAENERLIAIGAEASKRFEELKRCIREERQDVGAQLQAAVKPEGE